MMPVIRKIERVEANGSGRNSGEILIRLATNDTQQSFWVFMDKPRAEEPIFVFGPERRLLRDGITSVIGGKRQ